MHNLNRYNRTEVFAEKLFDDQHTHSISCPRCGYTTTGYISGPATLQCSKCDRPFFVVPESYKGDLYVAH